MADRNHFGPQCCTQQGHGELPGLLTAWACLEHEEQLLEVYLAEAILDLLVTLVQTAGGKLGEPAEVPGDIQAAVVHLVDDHEEGHAARVNVEQSAEAHGDPQPAVVHPVHDHEEGHAARVNVEQSAEAHGDLQATVVHLVHHCEIGHEVGVIVEKPADPWAAVVHPVHGHEGGHAGRVKVKEPAEVHDDLQVVVVHPA